MNQTEIVQNSQPSTATPSPKPANVSVTPQKTIVVSGGVAAGTQYVVTQSKDGSTILQPTNGSAHQYIVTVANPAQTEEQTVYPVQYSADARVATPSNEQIVPYNSQSVNNAQYYKQHEYSYSTEYKPQYQYQNLQQGQMVHQVGGHTYVIPSSCSTESDGYPMAHTTRAAPATVQWLLNNFEACDGTSLPRCTLYNFYMHHCGQDKIEPSNPASFGKLVRTIFRDLKTRRLGQRGNSKYHYYGIRIKADSELNSLVPDDTPVATRQPTQPHRKIRPSISDNTKSESNDPAEQEQKHKEYLGNPADAIPQVDITIEHSQLPKGVSMEDVNRFETLYRQHCESILELVVNLHFNLIETLWQNFWRKTQSSDNNLEEQLSKEKLFALCEVSEIQEFVKESDYGFYQALVEVLVPEVLRPIPSSLTLTIRNFAKGLESSMRTAVTSLPEGMISIKLAAVSAFSQTLRRYTSLNHLAQAARAVLQNPTQITQMMTDLNRVDFANIQEQASWVCQCEDGLVTQLEKDFKKYLQEQHSLEEWSSWLENVVNQVLKSYEDKEHFTKAARQFLLKWSFYSSMIIRDLTLRSAASFGSFHLIRLLYDEYIFYLVEHKVASATNQTPIAVMGELMEMADAGMQSDHMYGVKNANKINLNGNKSAMTVVSTDGSAPGKKSLVLVSNNANQEESAPAAKRQRVK